MKSLVQGYRTWSSNPAALVSVGGGGGESGGVKEPPMPRPETGVRGTHLGPWGSTWALEQEKKEC